MTEYEAPSSGAGEGRAPLPLRERVGRYAHDAAVRLTAACAAAIMLAGGCTYLDVKQRELIWRPVPTSWLRFDPGANGVEELWIPLRRGAGASASTKDPERPEPDRLHAWWWPNENPAAPVMLYLHGARWDLAGNAYRMRRLRELGFSLLAIDYRGFGKTGGDLPYEDEVYADAEAAWHYLRQREPEAHRRFVFGHSLGGAVAIELATRHRDMAGVIVESTFTSILDMADATSWLRYLPLGLVLTQRYDSLSRIEQVQSPLLIAHGTADRYVPAAMSERLYARATARKKLLLVEGASHSNVSALGLERYRFALAELFGHGVSDRTALYPL